MGWESPLGSVAGGRHVSAYSTQILREQSTAFEGRSNGYVT